MGFVLERARVVLTRSGEVVSVVALEVRIGEERTVFRREGVTDAEERLAVSLPGDEV